MIDIDKLEAAAKAASESWGDVVDGSLAKHIEHSLLWQNYRDAATPDVMLDLIAEVRALRAQLHDFKTAYGDLHQEVVGLRAFHDFFRDRCEGLFAQFGMPAVDAYNNAARKE